MKKCCLLILLFLAVNCWGAGTPLRFFRYTLLDLMGTSPKFVKLSGGITVDRRAWMMDHIVSGGQVSIGTQRALHFHNIKIPREIVGKPIQQAEFLDQATGFLAQNPRVVDLRVWDLAAIDTARVALTRGAAGIRFHKLSLREKNFAVVRSNEGEWAFHIVPRGNSPLDPRFFGLGLTLPLGVDPSVRALVADTSYELLAGSVPENAYVLGIFPFETGAWVVHSLIAELVAHPLLDPGFDYLDSEMLIPFVGVLGELGVDWEGNSFGAIPAALFAHVDEDQRYASAINSCRGCVELVELIAFGEIDGGRVKAVVDTGADAYEVVANTAEEVLDWVDDHVPEYVIEQVELDWIGMSAPRFIDDDIIDPRPLAANVLWASYTVLPDSGPHRFDIRPRTSFAVLVLGSEEPARLWGERMAVEVGRVWPALYSKTWSWFAVDLGAGSGQVQIFENCRLDNGVGALEFRRGKVSVYGELNRGDPPDVFSALLNAGDIVSIRASPMIEDRGINVKLQSPSGDLAAFGRVISGFDIYESGHWQVKIAMEAELQTTYLLNVLLGRMFDGAEVGVGTLVGGRVE